MWEEATRISFGQRRAYGEVAEAIEQASEAVEAGKAWCAADPVLLVIPCHRVVGAKGSLKGYAGGVRLKQRRLAFEEEGQKPLFVQRNRGNQANGLEDG